MVYLMVKQKFVRLILLGVFCGLIGAFLYYIIPKKYVATGSFYVVRKVQQDSPDFFEYEGFYAKQSAQAHAQVIIGLLESKEVLSETLKDLGLNVSEKNLRDLGRVIRVKKSSPQVVALIVKKSSSQEAKKVWDMHSENLLTVVSSLNNQSDPYLNVYKVLSEPVVHESYRNVFLNFAIGFLLGFSFGAFYFAFAEYLKE